MVLSKDQEQRERNKEGQEAGDTTVEAPHSRGPGPP